MSDKYFVITPSVIHDYAAWSAMTAYKVGDIVVLETGIVGIYKSISVNTGRQPDQFPRDWMLVSKDIGARLELNSAPGIVSPDINEPAAGEVLYNPATAYQIGATVIVTTGFHSIYEALEPSTGKFPPDNPTSWRRIGPTNRWAAFDPATGTFSTRTNRVRFTLTGGGFQSIALLELQATSVIVEVFVAGVRKFSTGVVKMQDKSVIQSWYDYAFNTIELQEEYVIKDIPVYPVANYTVTVNYQNGVARLGNCVVGRRTVFGFTQFGASIGIIDSSRKETDQFGNTFIVERKFRKRMNVSVVVNSGDTDGIARKLAELRAKPSVHVAANNIHGSLTVYGFPRDWAVNVEFPTQSNATFEIESV